MLSLHPSDRIFLYAGVTDMRKGFDGLCGLVINELRQNPSDGDLFVFINRSRNKIKILQWEEDGFAIWYKRLEQGTIEFPLTKTNQKSMVLNHVQVMMMLKGIGLEQRIKKRRYSIK